MANGFTLKIEEEAEQGDQIKRLKTETVDNLWEYMHKPYDWEVVTSVTEEKVTKLVDGKKVKVVEEVAVEEVLPILSQIYFYRGLNNYSGPGTEQKVRDHYEEKGCVCIKPNTPRLGEYAKYRLSVQAVNSVPNVGGKGKFWFSMFERPIDSGSDITWEFYEDDFNDFRRFLIKNEIVKLTPAVAERTIERLRSKLTILKAPLVHGRKLNDMTLAQIAKIENEVRVLSKIAGEKPKRSAKKRRAEGASSNLKIETETDEPGFMES